MRFIVPVVAILSITLVWSSITVIAEEPDSQDPAYHHVGELAGSLKSDQPLPLYDVDPHDLAGLHVDGIAPGEIRLGRRHTAPLTLHDLKLRAV